MAGEERPYRRLGYRSNTIKWGQSGETDIFSQTKGLLMKRRWNKEDEARLERKFKTKRCSPPSSEMDDDDWMERIYFPPVESYASALQEWAHLCWVRYGNSERFRIASERHHRDIQAFSVWIYDID
jgi:hypothetical protein